MTLNTKNWTLSYNINNKDYGVAFKYIDKTNYCLYVSSKATNMELQIVSKSMLQYGVAPSITLGRGGKCIVVTNKNKLTYDVPDGYKSIEIPSKTAAELDSDKLEVPKGWGRMLMVSTADGTEICPKSSCPTVIG
eukprot:336168_1